MNATATRRPSAADLGINPTGDRFYAARSAGRYRVFDALEADTHIEVAVCASRAKAEEKAAKLNADEAVAVARRAAIVIPEFAEPLTEEEAEEVAVALLGPARGAEAPLEVVTLDGEELSVTVAATPAPRPADRLLTVWVGWTVVDLIVPRVGDTDPAVAAVARKLQDRKPDGAKARTIRVNVAEREALAALATEIETDAVTAGSGALARSARALRGRLA